MVYLLIAGLFETGWAVSLKYSQGFTRLIPSIVTVAGMVASFAFLSVALRRLPLGTAYAVWTGIGTVGTFIMGVVLFRDSVSLPQAGCIALILIGIIGLKLMAPQ